MTSFVHVAQPTEHPGVIRAGRAADSIQHAAGDVFRPRSGATLLLAAFVLALLVVANQVVDTWAEGHLMLAWIVMWTVAFAALALAARPACAAVQGLRIRLRQSAATRHAAAQDDIMWQLAMTDPRMLADISRAMSHAPSGDPQPRA